MGTKDRTAPPREINNYSFTAELGSGSYATVYKAFNRGNRRNYAVKVFPKSNLKNSEEVSRFQREINASALLRHDNVAALNDFFWDNENFYLVLDFCGGGELFDYIVKHQKIDEPTAAIVVRQIAGALDFCHEHGVAHRDLKPENILIERWPRIKVTDFGLCGYIQGDKLMSTFCGSPVYCAPECLAKLDYDGRLSDVWSLGVILFVMVTGQNPWKFGNTSQLINCIMGAKYTIPDYVSAPCRDLIIKMMQLQPDDRITVSEVLRHKFIASADMSKLPPRQQAPKDQPEAPTIDSYSLDELAALTKEAAELNTDGVYSPFSRLPQKEDETEMLMKPTRQPSLPHLLLAGKSNGLRVPMGGMSLAGARQRSATSLLAPKPVMTMPMGLGTVKEE
jgi:serine/threonine protein kinase